MNITDYIDESLILLDDIRPGDKKQVLMQIVEGISGSGKIRYVKGFFEDVLRREEIESTAIGNQVAFPHARTDHVGRIFVAFARSRLGIDFHAIDGRPVHIFFTIGTPKATITEYLKVLARLSQMMKNADNHRKLLEAETPGQVLEILKSLEAGLVSPGR